MKIIGDYKYKLDENFDVWLWPASADENVEPAFLHQPFDPRDGVPFTNEEDADSWVALYIEERESFVPPVEQPIIEEPPTE